MADEARVIVGVSGSPTSFNALRRAVAEARLRHAPLEIVYVYPLALWALGYLDGQRSLERAAREQLAGHVADALGEPPADIAVTEVVVGSESPAAALAARPVAAEELLVLGAGDPVWWLRWRGSAVVRYCVRSCVCPVLVVPPHPLARELGRRRLRRGALDRELSQLLHR